MINATGHAFDGFIDAAFALITTEWKYIYWPLKQYEQLYHRSLDPYDEYDILQNYYLHQLKVNANESIPKHKRLRMKKSIPKHERRRMKKVTPSKTTPVGDSIQSTKEIYETLKARFYELKEYVQSGNKI